VLDRELEALDIDQVQRETIHPRKSYKMNSSCADILLFSSRRWQVSTPSLLTDADSAEDYGAMGQSSSQFWLDVQLRWGDYDAHDVERYARRLFHDYANESVSLYPCATGAIIAVDLAYNTYSGYGCWFPGLKPLLQQAMGAVIKNDPALHQLRERIRNQLQLFWSAPTESHLSATNYNELFRNQLSWFIDDSQVYRVVAHKTLEGNLATKPINGALIIFEPKTGRLYLKIVHVSTWAGQKRLTQLARWKSAAELSTLISSMPQQEKPQEIVVLRRGLMEAVQNAMLDFPNIVIRGSELALPFQQLLLIERIGDEVVKATESCLQRHNLYDDWLEGSAGSSGGTGAHGISTWTAFARLMLILRALHVDNVKARTILRPDVTVTTKEHHLWPSYTDDEWMDVEQQLRDLVPSIHTLAPPPGGGAPAPPPGAA
ncbi:MAG: hypothetical protein MHM6MM_001547, partial [Cercozoa sp. M6MM]